MNKRKKRPKRSLRFSGAILVCVLLGLVSGTIQGWAAPSFSVPLSPYSYHPLGKPDPFQPFVEQELTRKKQRARKQDRPLSIFPLQRADIGNFKLIGIAGTDHGRMAMVTDVQGKFFPLVEGTVIGLHGGRVAQILEDRVIVEERTAAGKGQYKTRRISLKLRNVDE